MANPLKLVVALALLIPETTVAATLCVNPGGTGGCFSTIQAAVDAAGPDDVIDIAAGTYERVVVRNEKRLTLAGAGSADTILEHSAGGGFGSVLLVGGQVTASGLTLRNGGVGASLGGRASLTLVDCVVTGNANGGIASDQFPYQDSRTLLKLTVIDSTISDNGLAPTEDPLGGIAVAGTVTTIVGSTISGNNALLGGGIRAINRSRVVVRASTISDNTAAQGGALDALVSRVSLLETTVVGNAAGNIAGGLRVDNLARIRVRASIVADNVQHTAGTPSDNDCVLVPSFAGAPQGRVTSLGYNVIESGCPETRGSVLRDVTGADPLLGPLQDNGGPTHTHALLAGSPALALVPTRRLCAMPDQRGVVRPTPCDSGAFEAP